MLTLIFLPNVGMGGSPSDAVVEVVAGKPGRYKRKYTLPDGRRVQATQEEIRTILESYRSQPERDISKIELPVEVEEVSEDEPYEEPSSQLFQPLMELAEVAGPQLVMEMTDDLTQAEAIALGRMINELEDEEAILALLLA